MINDLHCLLCFHTMFHKSIVRCTLITLMLFVYSDWNLLDFLQQFFACIFTSIWTKIFHKHWIHGNGNQICIGSFIQNTLQEFCLKYDQWQQILKGAAVCACKTFNLSNSRFQWQNLCSTAAKKAAADSLSCCHLQDILAFSYKILTHLSILWSISHTFIVLKCFKKHFMKWWIVALNAASV